jgi:uncharacterized protein (DUF58 family)
MKPILRLRSWGVPIALPLLLALQAFTPSPVLMLCLLILVGLFLSSLLWLFLLRRGLPFEERFRLINRSWLPVPWAEVQDLGDLPGYNVGRAMGLPAGSANVWVTRGTCERRGVYTMGPTALTLGDPFGFFELTLDLDDVRTFYVTPAIRPVSAPARPRTVTFSSSRSNAHYMAMNDTVSSIRPYAPSDPFKRIHWRSTAHRSTADKEEIWVKELDPNPESDCWVVLDLDNAVHAGEDLASTEEYAVTLTASLTYQLVQQHRAVGLLAEAAERIIIEPQYGQEHLWETLRVLAGLHADGLVPLAELLATARSCVRPGDSIIVVTPSARADWPKAAAILQQQSAVTTAFLIDAQSFGGTKNLREASMALARLGVASHVVTSGSAMILPETPAAPSRVSRVRAAAGGTTQASWFSRP